MSPTSFAKGASCAVDGRKYERRTRNKLIPRARSERETKATWNGTNGINKTKEQTAGYIRDTRSSFKAFHLLVTNGWLLGATEFRGAFGPRSRERDLLRRFQVTRFFIRTYVAAHDNFSFSMCPAAAPRTSNFPHPHFARL